MVFSIEDTVGSELLSWIKAFSKSVGMVMFESASRLETLNWGAWISPNGLIEFTEFTALWMAELREVASFWRPETMLFKVLCKKEVI
jgi:hypothetical protein